MTAPSVGQTQVVFGEVDSFVAEGVEPADGSLKFGVQFSEFALQPCEFLLKVLYLPNEPGRFVHSDLLNRQQRSANGK